MTVVPRLPDQCNKTLAIWHPAAGAKTARAYKRAHARTHACIIFAFVCERACCRSHKTIARAIKTTCMRLLFAHEWHQLQSEGSSGAALARETHQSSYTNTHARASARARALYWAITRRPLSMRRQHRGPALVAHACQRSRLSLPYQCADAAAAATAAEH